MSTPMFIREPLFYGKSAGTSTLEEVIPAAEEAHLIEKISVACIGFDTLAGRAALYLEQDAEQFLVKVLDIAAFVVAGGSQEFDVNLSVPVGCALHVKHDVTEDPGPDAVDLIVSAHGGILR